MIRKLKNRNLISILKNLWDDNNHLENQANENIKEGGKCLITIINEKIVDQLLM